MGFFNIVQLIHDEYMMLLSRHCMGLAYAEIKVLTFNFFFMKLLYNFLINMSLLYISGLSDKRI